MNPDWLILYLLDSYPGSENVGLIRKHLLKSTKYRFVPDDGGIDKIEPIKIKNFCPKHFNE